MTIDEARRLFAYGSWANGLMFDAAAALTAEQFNAPAASSYPSVGATLGHIVSAEWIWLQRWQGVSPTAAPAWATGLLLSELRAHLAEVETERDRFLETLAEADLERPVSYRTLSGQAWTDPLGDLLRHAVNHSTYHRGQVATQLRQLGVKPPGTDMIVYLRRAR